MSTCRVLAGVAFWCIAATACHRQSDIPGGGLGPQHTSVPGAAPSVHLVSPVSTGDWGMPAGDYGNLRYSTLDTIRTPRIA